jgi:hypothetical protein
MAEDRIEHKFDRVRENRSRRAAARRGWSLTKIQRRDEHAPGWNRWELRDADGELLISHVVTLPERYRDQATGKLATREAGIETGASLGEVEAWLRGERPSA